MSHDTTETDSLAPNDLSPADVAEYLRRHPDFFDRHPDLLGKLVPPSTRKNTRANGVVDFQHFMLRRLQAEIAQHTSDRHEMIGTARSNLNLLTRIHASVLCLLEAQSFEEMITAITGDLAVYLDVDMAALLIEAPDGKTPAMEHGDIHIVPAGRIDGWMQTHDVVLRGGIEGDPEIYGDGAGLVHSEALLRLNISRHAPVGMLAFGSRSPELFQEGQGTELVGFLARVVERCVRAWLDLPE